LVEAYRKIGYQVVANSRTIADSGHPEIATVAGDIADPETAERLVEVAISRFCRIDTSSTTQVSSWRNPSPRTRQKITHWSRR
jgi:hypothetical protein